MSPIPSPYTVSTYDLNGNVQLASVPFDTLQYGFVLNGAGSLDMTVDGRKGGLAGITRANFEPGQMEIRVNRGGVIQWGGFIWTSEYDTDDRTLRIGADGYFSKLFHRFVIGVAGTDDLLYDTVEQFNIAWGLISYTQGKAQGDMGITRGAAAPSGVQRSINYRWWEGTNIGDAIQQLAQTKSGFDFEITPSKVWNVYSPRRGTDLSGNPAMNMTLDVNVAGISQTIDATGMASDVFAIGAGQSEWTCIAYSNDPLQRAAIKRLESVGSFTNIKNFTHLQRKADRLLSMQKGPISQPQLSLVMPLPAFGSYGVGDKVRVVADDGFLQLNQPYRIIAYEVHLAQTVDEVVTVHFDSRVLDDA